MANTHVVIVTGLSGSGKSSAIKALEDSGFFCVDNLPVVLLDKFLVLADQHEEISRVAVGIDVREGPFLDQMGESLERVRALGHKVEVIFLDASDDVLVRRFSETRRRHPLAGPGISIRVGIERERQLTSHLKEMADWVIDTSDLTVHELKRKIQDAYESPHTPRTSCVVQSFGFKYGVPREADYVFDCRFLPNPYFVPDLRPLSGMDEPVTRFLVQTEVWGQIVQMLDSLLRFVLPLHEREGRPLVTVAFGCTGGRHRSVALAEEIARRLREEGVTVRVYHRDLEAEA